MGLAWVWLASTLMVVVIALYARARRVGRRDGGEGAVGAPSEAYRRPIAPTVVAPPARAESERWAFRIAEYWKARAKRARLRKKRRAVDPIRRLLREEDPLDGFERALRETAPPDSLYRRRRLAIHHDPLEIWRVERPDGTYEEVLKKRSSP